MSWIQKLYETYEACCNNEQLMTEQARLLPIGHTVQQAHIHIEIDNYGNFKRASILDKLLIPLPATEKSAGRTSGEAPHPLIDKIQYCGGDYAKYGGTKKSYFKSYLKLLSGWANSPYTHHKVQAVLRYAKKEQLVQDLISCGVLFTDNQNILRTSWPEEEGAVPPIFRMLTKKKVKGKAVQDQGDALVCWSIHIPGDPESDTWGDKSLQNAWISYLQDQNQGEGFCHVEGKKTLIANQHPAKLRHSGDKAKLISANDNTGYTYRGRFTENLQACSVGSVISQKTHSSLAWLISRQGVRNGDQAFVCWAVSGKTIPQPLTETHELWDEDTPFTEEEIPQSPDHTRDAGQRFASKLKSFIKGYAKTISPTEDIVMIGLDSATPGRMSIIYYRELLGSEFLVRLENWHTDSVWWQRLTRKKNDTKNKKKEVFWSLSAPSPKNIAEAAFGQRLDDKLKKATIERLVPCIMDGQQVPLDLMTSCISRTSNRIGMEHWEWEKCMGVACALYRSFHIRHPDPKKRKEYSMALDVTCTSRDYLYGRLLAIADHIEAIALYAANPNGNSHPTAANRLMQRFADYPCSTWLTIEKSLQPYMQRLHSLRPSFLTNMNKLLDDVHALFERSDYMNDTRLSGEYLLGFHCQRREFKRSNDKGENA
ncbi:type I-C CRISPR-associated protein Cas8c/Csd1 [Desulfobotulus sp. H1]|uniref:Type I-C CRISPR-associated protein Cas8c/Csd1 n=1 Tax=Desulfobotulus pelophilus TaxID=2823377 RepID=A0ABT3NBU9_9BACT|nr:type I-C CRISPR-associated protein Cas8c/Csd1 [Desulfobotulus pelophilus]MCW7754651.1 type I-C CRISPR-associated protein Cas8c/Csd1 [Desulfobotulus pelophilus]